MLEFEICSIDVLLTKANLKKQIKNFPDEFSLDELIERLTLIEKIERGNNQSKTGEVISESDLDKELEKWFN